jgi:hypothetical protein
MRRPQIGLHFHRTSQQRRRLAIAPTHDLEVRKLLVHRAIARVVVERALDPGLRVAIARALQSRAHRIDFERRQFLLRGEIAGALQRFLRGFELAGFERELRADQVRFDEIVVLAQDFFDQRFRVFEALGKHARQSDLGVRIAREDLQRVTECFRCVVVLMRLQEQPRPANARQHSARVGLHEITKALVRVLQVADCPQRFGLHHRVR